MCSILFMENSPYKTGFAIAISPLFFALTEKIPMSGKINTIRFAIFKEGMTVFDEQDDDESYLPAD